MCSVWFVVQTVFWGLAVSNFKEILHQFTQRTYFFLREIHFQFSQLFLNLLRFYLDTAMLTLLFPCLWVYAVMSPKLCQYGDHLPSARVGLYQLMSGDGTWWKETRLRFKYNLVIDSWFIFSHRTFSICVQVSSPRKLFKEVIILSPLDLTQLLPNQIR